MGEWDDVEIEQEELPRGHGTQRPGLWPSPEWSACWRSASASTSSFGRTALPSLPQLLKLRPLRRLSSWKSRSPNPDIELPPLGESDDFVRGLIGKLSSHPESLHGLSRKTWCEG